MYPPQTANKRLLCPTPSRGRKGILKFPNVLISVISTPPSFLSDKRLTCVLKGWGEPSMVILSSLFKEEVGPYQRAFQTIKLASWQNIFSLEFAFILWCLSASPWHGLLWDVVCSCGSTGDRRLHT